MREWHLTSNDPMAPHIAADARAGRTVYNDDQIWHLRLGQPTEPALALETRYGGRVGLARLVPIWRFGTRQVYETQGYHEPPVLTQFAPDYLRLRADLTLAIRLTFEFWVMESQAVGGRFTCQNTSSQPQTFQFELAAQAVREDKAVQMFFLTLQNDEPALQVARLPYFQPVLLLEGAAAATAVSKNLTRSITLEPGATTAIRWVLAALPDRDASLLKAHHWLTVEDWDAGIAAVEARLKTQPDISTGHPDWDAALAWSQQIVLRSFLAATGSLPHPSFVESRRTGQGYAVGGSHPGGLHTPWGGQTVPDALMILPTVALAAPELAAGIVQNFLAVQRGDGWIDAKPGLDSQRAQVLAPPMLATLAYMVYHYTGSKKSLEASLDKLVAFFNRWFKPDMDRDGDGLPEWSQPEQGAFTDSPVFAQHRRWAQGLDISTVEAPDLIAYLVREAGSLVRIGKALDRDDIAAEFTTRQQALADKLNEFWDDEAGRFFYRDRDSHTRPAGETIYESKGDQPMRDHLALPNPSRLILRVTGGLSHKPKTGCTIEGVNASGHPANETIPNESFDWYRGMGIATTKTVWREIKYLKFDGLSRVYSVQVSTVDLTRHDQSLFMPLWAGTLDKTQVERLVAHLTDPDQYWRKFGVSGCAATDPAYDPTNAEGCGGVWPFWNTMIAWALLDLGYTREAADLFRRLLDAQIRSLSTEKTFRALYDPDSGAGLRDAEVIGGVASMAWFARLFGAFVLRADTVVLGGPFAFEGETMTWEQYGVTIKRSADGTVIHFPTGHEVKLAPDAEAQVIHDPKAKPAPAPPKPTIPTDPGDPGSTSTLPPGALPTGDADE